MRATLSTKSLLNVSGRFYKNTIFKFVSDGQVSAIRLIALDRKEAEEFYEVYRNVVPEYSQMASLRRSLFAY